MSLRNLKQWKNFVTEAASVSMSVAKGLCFLHVIDTYICTVALTYGPSMLPTLSLTGNIILADRISPWFGKVGCDDIVILRSPVNPRRLVTKRIIGVEGDSITYVIDPNYSQKTNTIVVPKGHVWVQGDNPFDSKDSRNFGAVPYGLLEAKVFWRAQSLGFRISLVSKLLVRYGHQKILDL